MRGYDLMLKFLCFNIGLLIVAGVFGATLTTYEGYDLGTDLVRGAIFGLIVSITAAIPMALVGVNPIIIVAVGTFLTTIANLWWSSVDVFYSIVGDIDAGAEFAVMRTFLSALIAFQILFLIVGVIQWGTGGWKQNE